MPKMRCRMPAQPDRKPRGPEMGPECRHRRWATGGQVRQKRGRHRQAGADQVAPMPEPAAVRRLRHRMAGTGALGRRTQARFRLRRQRRRPGIVQRARQPRRKAAGRQRPCHVGVRAIPAGNQGIPPARLAAAGAMAGKTAAAPGMRGAAFKLCVAPSLRGNVVLAGQRQVPIELHGRLPARRQAPHGPPFFPNTSHHARVPARTAQINQNAQVNQSREPAIPTHRRRRP